MDSKDAAREPQRLPVNPRRHKVAPEQRKRVSTACNSCNVRRIKCSGNQPCKACANANRECVYPLQVEKVSIAKTDYEEMKSKIDLYEKALQEAQPDATRRQELLYHAATSPTSSSSSSHSPFSGTSSSAPVTTTVTAPAPAEVKLQLEEDDPSIVLAATSEPALRFLGETNGAAFLDHFRELVDSALPNTASNRPHESHAIPYDGGIFLSTLGQYYSPSTRAQFNYNVNPIVLPNTRSLQTMLSETRYVIQDGNGEWPSGGMYWFGDLDVVPAAPPTLSLTGVPDLDPYRYLSVTHATLALHAFACGDWPTTQDVHASSGDLYFARAAVLFGNILDMKECSFQAVSTLALMALYLLEETKRDAAYMHIAVAAHMCLVLGAHRGVTDERAKRLFWTVYVLDRWLGCLLGRPSIISEDAIRVAEPLDAPDMPPADGLRANVELSRISSFLVSNTYRIAPSDGTARSEMTQNPAKILWMLDQWKTKLPPSLQLSPNGISNDPGACMLHMRHNQLIIIATRPLFLVAVKRLLAERSMAHASVANLAARLGPLSDCIEAAQNNMRITRYMTSVCRYPRPHHTQLHFLFTTAICLVMQDLVYDPQFQTAEIRAQRMDDLHFAITMLKQDEEFRGQHKQTGCENIIQDLQSLVARLIALPVIPPQPSVTLPLGQEAAFAGLNLDGEFGPTVPVMQHTALYNELATWMNDEWLSMNHFVEYA